MRFVFQLWNHTDVGKRSLEDVIGIIGKQLRALGHEAEWYTENDDWRKLTFIGADLGYNVLVEGFTGPSTAVIAAAHEQGARFICLATEEPTDKGFNHGTQREMAWRQDTFAGAARFFDAIWHLVPGEAVTRWYAQHAPSAHVELGFAPSLVRKQLTFWPEYEFGFFGSLSKRRLKILKRLAALTPVPRAIRVVADFPSQNERDHAIQNVKVVLQLRKFEEMGLVSSSRCNTAICNGRPVVAEPHDVDLSKPWDSIVTFTKSMEDFYLTASAMRRNWREEHARQLAQLRETLPPEVCVGRALSLVRASRESAA